MNRFDRTEKALQVCLTTLKEYGCSDIVDQAEAIINEPQIRIGEHFYGIAVEDDGGGRVNGTPILHETDLHKSRTIKSAIERAASCSDRYGKKYIALITILEEV